ncbi:hypothetical protein COCOBI_12-5250 [Coccomyxa sp. Obi]|nr:hypothetical protein COCOBI_12-5250 [Coccomyxa sp. Obi]
MQRRTMLEKRLTDELKALDGLQQHMNRELPWFRDGFLRLHAKRNEHLEAGIDLEFCHIFELVDERNLPEETRQNLLRLWVFWALDVEAARHKQLVKQILDGKQKQLEGSWWRRTLRHCLSPFTQPMQSAQQDDLRLTVEKGVACTDSIHDSFSSVSGDRS